MLIDNVDILCTIFTEDSRAAHTVIKGFIADASFYSCLTEANHLLAY